MTGPVATETRGLPAAPESAEPARVFVRAALTAAGCPDCTGPELCTEDLVGDATRRALAAAPDATILLRVDTWPGGARIEVRDTVPRPATGIAALFGHDVEPGQARWEALQAAAAAGFERAAAWCLFSWDDQDLPQLPPVAGPARRHPRRPGRLAAARRKLARWRYRRRAARPSEREARDVWGLPWWHPENMTGHPRQGGQLAELSRRLWPGSEYTREFPA